MWVIFREKEDIFLLDHRGGGLVIYRFSMEIPVPTDRL